MRFMEMNAISILLLSANRVDIEHHEKSKLGSAKKQKLLKRKKKNIVE